MAFGMTADTETAATLRRLTGLPQLTQVTVYDAEFPADAGQQFVSAVATVPATDADGDPVEVTFDLTAAAHADLNDVLYDLACEMATSVKFFVDLPE